MKKIFFIRLIQSTMGMKLPSSVFFFLIVHFWATDVRGMGACSVIITSNPANGFICVGSCATLTATATGTPPFHYSWMPGGLTTDTITVCPALNTTYTVTVTDSSGNCIASATAPFVIKINPVFSFNSPFLICTDSCERLTPVWQGPSILFTWSPDSFLSSSTGPQPICCPIHDITYTVTGNLNGCIKTDTVTVRVIPNPCYVGMEEQTNANLFAIAPNPFSNSFILTNQSKDRRNMKLKIYNILGEIVKNISIEKEQAVIQRENLTDGIYFYFLFRDEEILYSGKLLVKQ